MARVALAAPIALATLGLAACRGILGIEEGDFRAADAATDAPAPCVATGASCAGEDVLRTCASVGQLPIDQPCAWGCTDAVGAPRCAQLLPSGGGAVKSTDLEPDPALAQTVMAKAVVINTDDGSITTLRAAGEGIGSGIEFTIRNDLDGDEIAVFRFASLVAHEAISVIGARSIALVAHGDITVNQLIDLRGLCDGTTPGPGGWPGGAAETSAPQLGGGTGGTGVTATSGGGGGSHGTRGGTGGSASGSAPAGRPGSLNGDAAISRLRGGCGGGGGGTGGGTGGGPGGGGGGAIQIVSDGIVTFGGAGGGVNAGGCGGKAGAMLSSGGGGGAGGTILVEAPIVRLEESARFAVNGGGGGGGRAGGDGERGRIDGVAAGGGAGGAGGGGTGGAGGVSAALVGGDGGAAPQSGGAGGGTGRIRFNTRRGAIEADAGARISPALAEVDTTATQGVAATQ